MINHVPRRRFAEFAVLCLLFSWIPLTYIMVFVTERLRGGVWAAVGAHAGFNLMDSLTPQHGDRGALLEAMIMIGIAVLLAVVWRLSPATKTGRTGDRPGPAAPASSRRAGIPAG